MTPIHQIMLITLLYGVASDRAYAQHCEDTGVAAARLAFNQAIQADDIAQIGRILAEDVVLVTGTDSDHYRGKDAQMALWQADVGNPGRLRYVRDTESVVVSSLYPIALEQGRWQGTAADGDILGGSYSAKWRCSEGGWRLEAELFMTERCSGALCPPAAGEGSS